VGLYNILSFILGLAVEADFELII